MLLLVMLPSVSNMTLETLAIARGSTLVGDRPCGRSSRGPDRCQRDCLGRYDDRGRLRDHARVETRGPRGERVALEPTREEHAERLRRLRATPEVERWWEPGPEGWPQRTLEPVEQLTVLVDGEVAGYVQFGEEANPDARHADVDIFLGPAHQGRGLGTEVLRTVVRHLIEERGHHRITLYTSPKNGQAIRSYEKAGFRPVGVLRKAARSRVTGQWEDELLMELVT